MEITELHPMLQDLVISDIDTEDYEDLVNWFLAIAEYLYQDAVFGLPVEWYYPNPAKGPVSPEAWRSMAIYDYVRAFSLSEEAITELGWYVWDARIAFVQSIADQSKEL